MPRLGPSVTGASGMQAFADPVHGLAVAHIGRAPLGALVLALVAALLHRRPELEPSGVSGQINEIKLEHSDEDTTKCRSSV